MTEQAQPIFRDPKRYAELSDPNLSTHYPEKDLNQVVAIAAMCLQEEAAARPLMSDVVTALSFLSTSPPPEGISAAPLPPPTNCTAQKSFATANESESESESESSVPKDDKAIAAVSAKYHECDDASENEYDYYENENQHDYSPQDTKETKESHSKSKKGNKSIRKKHGVDGSSKKSSASKSSSLRSDSSSEEESHDGDGHLDVHHFNHTSMGPSEEGSYHRFEHSSSRGSDDKSLHSQ